RAAEREAICSEEYLAIRRGEMDRRAGYGDHGMLCQIGEEIVEEQAFPKGQDEGKQDQKSAHGLHQPDGAASEALAAADIAEQTAQQFEQSHQENHVQENDWEAVMLEQLQQSAGLLD